jgi:predicted nucleotidyltransferase
MLTAEKTANYRQGLQHRLSQALSQTELSSLDQVQAEAESLARELIEKYGAKRVILFGSIAQRRPLRPDSDIDLAVEGMASEIYYKLVGELWTKSGRSVDLVRLENVRPGVKRVILSKGIILMTETGNINQLIMEIEAEIEHFWQLVNDAAEAANRCSGLEQVSTHDMRGIAMLLAETYSGAENLMLRIAKSLNEPIPAGKAWHKELLDQLSNEIPNARPALFNKDTIELLDEFRRFRHVVHHVYSFEYDWEQMRKLLLMAEPLLTQVIRDAEEFRVFLMSLMPDNPSEIA